MAMRLVALAAGREPLFTLGGTLLIIMVGVVFGAVFGLLFTAMRQWFPGTALAKGIGYGAVFAGPILVSILRDGARRPQECGSTLSSLAWRRVSSRCCGIGYALGMVILLERF